MKRDWTVGELHKWLGALPNGIVIPADLIDYMVWKLGELRKEQNL